MQKLCVNACCKFFSLVGIPSVITSDNATYFTSQLNDKFMELFGCKPRFSTVLHPGGNSLVERMNASLKKMLAHVSQKYPKQWHKLLPIVLWCMQDAASVHLLVLFPASLKWRHF